MSKRRKPGDWVYLPAYGGACKLPPALKVQIQPEDDSTFDPHYGCEDPDCRRWAVVLSEPDMEREGYRHKIQSVSECMMFDEQQELPRELLDFFEKFPVTPLDMEKLKRVLLGPQRNLAIRRILLPRDTNHRGEVFGGAILAEIDLAGAVEARKHTKHDVATRFMNGIEFNRPVSIGDVVTLYTTLIKIGNTSLTIKVEVEFSRDGEEAPVAVVATEVVYVAIERNKDGSISKVPVEG